MMMVFGSVSSILPLLVALLALCTNNISALNIHGLHVDGNKIKNQDGEVLHLRVTASSNHLQLTRSKRESIEVEPNLHAFK
jgi:hypothetical protein